MSATLEDESGSEPTYEISWVITTNSSGENPYNISGTLTADVNINSTKSPCIPEDLYNKIGIHATNYNISYYRCCTPIEISDDGKYDGFVNYSMCQATGYKLKSNKELPCKYQVFSKLIPMTTHTDGSDKPNQNQIYPMFSILEFEHYGENRDINAINIKMCRVTGIFEKDGVDTFTQTKYGTGTTSIQYLIEVNDDNVDEINKTILKDEDKIKPETYMYGAWVSSGELANNNKYLYIKY
jgi:hypothetical protein